jgi:glucose/mannose-6-phosphate isomerase
MKELITNFPQQLNEGINISKTVELKFDRTISNIVICGLGGSGIGGEIVKKWLKSNSFLPIEVCHSYDLPEYVSRFTLVIACSYSGNTEETLSCLDQALELDALIIGVTSGGKMKETLKKTRNQFIQVPGGLPPRSALAYPLVQIIEIFEQVDILKYSIRDKIKGSIELLNKEQVAIQSIANDLLKKSSGKRILLYSEDQFSTVLLRTCQQINENSKELAFFNVIPEMNHNEIVGWAEKQNDLCVISVRSSLENERNGRRLDITEEVVSKKADLCIVNAKGEDLIEQTLYLIHVFDWLSFYKAEQKGIDVTEVDVIDYLKAELSK